MSLNFCLHVITSVTLDVEDWLANNLAQSHVHLSCRTSYFRFILGLGLSWTSKDVLFLSGKNFGFWFWDFLGLNLHRNILHD